MAIRRIWLAGLALLAAVAPPAWGAQSDSVTSARAAATLVSESDAVAPGQPVRVGLRLRMAPGWHTYWKNPGDAGAAPSLAFRLPAGVTAGPIRWPAPSRNAEGPLMTYGYAGDLLLPVTLRGAAGALAVHLHATWLVCQNICVPEQGDFTLELPAGTPAPSAQAGLFAAADAAMPRPAPWSARIAPDGVLTLSGPGLSPAAVRAAWFIPDGDTLANAAPQTMTAAPDRLALQLTFGRAGAPKGGLSGLVELRDGGGQSTAYRLTAQPGPAAARTPLARLLGFAFLGGLILNLMPCVFPVLAMKAAGLAGLARHRPDHAGGGHPGRGHHGRGHALAQAGAYTAGVLATFLAIAFLLLALRAGGAELGWGFQFQSPVFVAAMAWLLFAVGLNLSGVFAVGGPAGSGQELARRRGLVGSFFTGLLAVLVATPCTAPFMATAIAAGLAGSAALTLGIFAAMGLGLAAPYVVLAAVPAVARAMPRPGRWMDILRQALAFPMYAATAWLVWVLSQQAGPLGVLAASAGLVLIGLAGWALGLAQAGIGRRSARAVATLAVLAALAVLWGVAATPPQGTAQASRGTEAFSPARLAALRAEGRPVFLNITAAWCVTCLVNERLVLDAAPARAVFAAHNVALLTGDWTRQDAVITSFLRAHGHDGVPLYLFYPAGGGHPVVLPQVLTGGMIARLFSPIAG